MALQSFHQHDSHHNAPRRSSRPHGGSAVAFFPVLLELTGFLGVIAVIVAGFTAGAEPHQRGPLLTLLAVSAALVLLGQRRS